MTERTKPERTASYSAPALIKGLDILELLAERRNELTMKEISEGLGRTKNELFRMIVALQERGYIQRNPDTEAFSLGERLFKLGLHAPSSQDLLTAAMPELEAFAAECGQSPHLVVLASGRTVVTAVVPGGEDMSFTLHLGYGRVATDATSGIAIMAFMPETMLDCAIKVAEAHLDAPMDRALLDERLKIVRDQGYWMRDSSDFIGITDICCPIFGPQGTAIASIVIPFVNRHNRPDGRQHALEVLRRACNRISDKLSHRINRTAATG
ncbi:IclR family transcriptional regulator [Psychromarinibacter sp. S121]|uniref:IclR family transcriptional regulator n=1 Tax=Psychromarinibacter sp. S121 TaxID=3415127 RepID=UPI003C79733C